MLYEVVHFEERFVHFIVFDALTTDNSTKIKKSVPRYSTNLRRIIWVGSPENRRWKNIWLLRIRRRIRVDPRPGGYRVHVDRCINNEQNKVTEHTHAFITDISQTNPLLQWPSHITDRPTQHSSRNILNFQSNFSLRIYYVVLLSAHTDWLFLSAHINWRHANSY
jgi:hypothetical protein